MKIALCHAFYDDAKAAEQQGAGDADGAFVGLEVVVDDVLACNEWGLEYLGGLGCER